MTLSLLFQFSFANSGKVHKARMMIVISRCIRADYARQFLAHEEGACYTLLQLASNKHFDVSPLMQSC